MLSFGLASGAWADVPPSAPAGPSGATRSAALRSGLRPVIGQRFPLEQAAEAHAAIEARATIGKTLLGWRSGTALPRWIVVGRRAGPGRPCNTATGGFQGQPVTSLPQRAVSGSSSGTMWQISSPSWVGPWTFCVWGALVMVTL